MAPSSGWTWMTTNGSERSSIWPIALGYEDPPEILLRERLSVVAEIAKSSLISTT